MAAAQPIIRDGMTPRPASAGDVVFRQYGKVADSVLATNGAGVWTAALMLSGLIVRTTVGAGYSDTTDTAANLIAAATQNGQGPSVGDSFVIKFINTVAQVLTVVAGTGCTLGTTVTSTLQASLNKEYLVRFTNVTPQTVVGGLSWTTGTKVATGMTLAQTSAVSVGQLVTGTHAGSSAKIASIQPSVGITTDVNFTATDTTTGSLTFSPTYTIDAIGMG